MYWGDRKNKELLQLGAFFQFGKKGGKMANIYGYIRVSSRDQNEGRQITGMAQDSQQRTGHNDYLSFKSLLV